MAGRFAPSPSGPLHFGSLIAAVGSYLIAKSRHTEWLVRIEDIDPPREVTGASDLILRQLEAFGLHWDSEVSYQSQQLDHYAEIIEQLKSQGLVYACNCTRKKIKSLSKTGYYPNICAAKKLSFNGEVAIRLRHGEADYSFVDQIQGPCQFEDSLYAEDFAIRRKDGLIAYQLAVVVDDIEQGIDHVVRGCDLLDSTPRQLRLYEVLKGKAPDWYHLPLAINPDGNKLSKQNHAPAIDSQQASKMLCHALEFLGQPIPSELQQEKPAVILDYALSHFQMSQIPANQQILYLA
ncbi:MAG TPA: tRNA glutamyl-Q(34) synthetase GluQRS [Kangiella sp.]|uniref:tRNA glutamyl-Q(34) synthetase GluQRS n=1 Tax=Kangiella sp. TaxID=1920245 RepID=UPI002F93DF67